jgi:hypothetical protein
MYSYQHSFYTQSYIKTVQKILKVNQQVNRKLLEWLKKMSFFSENVCVCFTPNKLLHYFYQEITLQIQELEIFLASHTFNQKP